MEWDGYAWLNTRKAGLLKGLVDRIGVDYVGHPVSVFLGNQGSPSTFEHIERLGRVTKLALHGPFITDAGLAHLAGLTDLASLEIGDRVYGCSLTIAPLGTARVTDAGMPYLKDLVNLVLLDLNGTQVGNAGLACLANLTELRVLRLEATQVTDAGLVHLKKMTKLTHLELGGTAVSDAGLERLKSLTSLKYLALPGTRITDSGVPRLKRLAGIHTLDLRNTRVTDAGRERLLQKFPKLFFMPVFDPPPDLAKNTGRP